MRTLSFFIFTFLPENRKKYCKYTYSKFYLHCETVQQFMTCSPLISSLKSHQKKFPITICYFIDKLKIIFLNWVYVIYHSNLIHLTARWLADFFSVCLTPTLNQAYTVDISPLLNCLSAPLGQIWPCTYVGPQLGCSETSGHQGLQPSGPSTKNHFSSIYFF